MKNDSHKIGIVMGGYLDENDKLMDTSELRKRISIKTKLIESLEAQVKLLMEMGGFYDDDGLFRPNIFLALKARKTMSKVKEMRGEG